MTIINGTGDSVFTLYVNRSAKANGLALLSLRSLDGVAYNIRLDEADVRATITALTEFLPGGAGPELGRPAHEDRLAQLREARWIFPDAAVSEVIEAAGFLLDGTTKPDGPEYVFAGAHDPRVINEGDEEPPVDGANWVDRDDRTWWHTLNGWRWTDGADPFPKPRSWHGEDGLKGPANHLPLTEIIA